MYKTLLPILALGLAVVPATALAQGEYDLTAEAPLIELGVAEQINSAPDNATFGTGIQTTAPTASEALRMNSAAVEKLMARMKALGIAERDIQTSGIGLNARYDYQREGEPVFRGYEVSNQLSIKLRDIDRLGEVLDALVAAGATNLYGPTFGIDKDEELKREARAKALERGRVQALDFARAAGFSDVRLLSVSENIQNSGPSDGAIRVTAASSEAKRVPIAPGEVGTTVLLGLKYQMVR